MYFRTFIRNWWTRDPRTGRLLPIPGRKTYKGRYDNEKDARAAAVAYNKVAKPGPLSRKMEYEEVIMTSRGRPKKKRKY